MKNEIIRTHTNTTDGMEARLVKTERGYFVGAYDLDAEEYYTGSRIFPYGLENAYERANKYFDDFVTPLENVYVPA